MYHSGTHIYQRFDASGIDEVLNLLQSHASNARLDMQLLQMVQDVVMDDHESCAGRTKAVWNQRRESLVLPPGIDLMMADVCTGSSTISMVGTSVALSTEWKTLFISLHL